jgi:hypothetical protein
MRFNKRLGGVIGALVMLLAGAAVVYAAFSASGTGSGRATAVTAQPIAIAGVSCGTADLYPGGPAGAICFTLTNTNPYTVHFTNVAYLPPPTVITANSTNCPAGNVAFAYPPPTTTVDYTVGPGQTTGLLSIPGVLKMESFAADGCQGATFNVPILLTGTQQ